MIRKIKNTMAITLSILLILTTISFAEEGFSEPQEETSPIISLPENTVKGQFSAELKGNSVSQSVVNGDFSDGTNGWSGYYGVISAANNVLTLTGTGANPAPRLSQVVNISVKTGDKYFMRSRQRVTNSECNYISLENKTASSSVKQILNPTANTWYEMYGIYTADTDCDNINVYPVQSYTDNETANGKVMEVQEVMVINMIAHGLDTLTEDEMNERITYWFDGTKSTNSVRLTSVNKNLIDEFEEGSLSSTTGDEVTSSTSIRTKKYIRVESGEQYTLSHDNTNLTDGNAVVFYDKNKNFMSSDTNSFSTKKKTFTIPSNAVYVRFRITFDSELHRTIDNSVVKCQLEKGTTPTDYVEHEKSEVYIDIPFNDGELTQTPNKSTDGVDLNTGIATQRNKKYALQSEDVSDFDNITFSNFDIVRITAPDDYILGENGISGNYSVLNYTEINNSSIEDIVSNANKSYNLDSSNQIRLTFPKGTYTSLAEAQADLAGTELIYQLAEEQTYELPTTPLIAYPNGTIIIEAAVSNASIYNDGITIPESQPPVETIESIKKFGYDANGVLTITTIDLSNVSVTDGRHIQIDGANNGERYEYTYQYPKELTAIPTITYSVPIDQTGQLDGLTNMVEQNANLIDTIMKQIKTLSDEIDGIE